MTALRDVYWKVRHHTAQTTTKTLPIFFLEKYTLTKGVDPLFTRKRGDELGLLKRNVHFEANMQSIGQV